jgi:acetyl esterase/lipase
MSDSDVMTRWAEPPDLVLRYGDHADQLVDVWLPLHRLGVQRPAGVVAVLHGGFWRQEFDRIHVRPLANALRADGFAVAAIEYRRTGGAGGWPMTFDDVRTASEWLPAALSSAAPGATEKTMIAVGHSAGGHLAMWAGLNSDAIRRVVALAPVADLYLAHRRRLGHGATAALLGGGPSRFPDRYAAADVARALPGRVSTTVIHGDQDRQVPVEMSRALRGVALVELVGVGHFELIDPLSAAWPAVLSAVRQSEPSGPGSLDPIG